MYLLLLIPPFERAKGFATIFVTSAVRIFVHVVPVHPSGQMIRSIEAFTPSLGIYHDGHHSITMRGCCIAVWSWIVCRRSRIQLHSAVAVQGCDSGSSGILRCEQKKWPNRVRCQRCANLCDDSGFGPRLDRIILIHNWILLIIIDIGAPNIQSERGPTALLLNLERSPYRAGYDLGES